MTPDTKKKIVKILIFVGKVIYTGLAYGLVSHVWRMQQYERNKINKNDDMLMANWSR